MTSKEVAKNAYESAEKELNEEQIEKLKVLVKKTLERIKEIDKQVDELQEEKRILKLDIDDLKEGRLDRIEERQTKDDKALKFSVIRIHKTVNHYYPYRVYEPYVIEFPFPQVYCGSSDAISMLTSSTIPSFTLTGTIAKQYTAGTYDVNGNIVHLR